MRQSARRGRLSLDRRPFASDDIVKITAGSARVNTAPPKIRVAVAGDRSGLVSTIRSPNTLPDLDPVKFEDAYRAAYFTLLRRGERGESRLRRTAALAPSTGRKRAATSHSTSLVWSSRSIFRTWDRTRRTLGQWNTSGLGPPVRTMRSPAS